MKVNLTKVLKSISLLITFLPCLLNMVKHIYLRRKLFCAH